MSADTLENLHNDITALLKSDEWLDDNGISVLNEFDKTLAENIANSLAVLTERNNKIGACVLLMSPVGNDDSPDVAFGPLDVDIVATVLEDPDMNQSNVGTGKPALTIARRVEMILRHYDCPGIVKTLIPEPQVIVPVRSDLAPVAYEVRMHATEADSDQRTRVSRPVFTPASGASPVAVTISTVTSGATIYYTTDGSHPYAGNPNAVQYAGAIQINQATTLRARAFKAGSYGSFSARALIT